MNITIIAPGSRGDVQPYVALGKGLQEAGHSVCVLTSQNFQTLVTDYGLDFFDMDVQTFWGQRLYALGVGPRPIPRKRLTADRLADSIRRAVSNMEMRMNAASLGERIRAENGIAQAVEVIEQSRG